MDYVGVLQSEVTVGVPGDKQFGVTVVDRNYVVSFSCKRSGMSCSLNSLKGVV